MRCENLTAARLRELLAYDPESGYFTRRSASSTAKAGERAGYTHKGTGYVIICVDGARFVGQRLAWLYITGAWPLHEIDHKDLDRSNNKWGNLREATHQQNCANLPRPKNNKSGFKGVYWLVANSKWRAHIRHNGKLRHLGLFDTPEAAHQAYYAAAIGLYGEFARAS